MLILLNHAGPLEGSLEANYELYQGPSATYDTTPNNTNNILNTKDSVNLKRCVSSNYKNKTNAPNSEIIKKPNTNLSLPSPEELNDVNFELEQNKSLMKEKEDLEEFYKNILLKLNEDDKRREEEMRLHVIYMNSHLKYLEQKKQKLENYNYLINSNFMDRKYDFDLNDQKITKEIENNNNKNKLLLKSINDAKKKAKLENDLNQKEYNKRTRQVASTLRNQIKTNKETGILAQKQLNEINKIYEQKINSIRNKYDMAEEKYRLLQENLYQNGGVMKNEFEKIMRIFRERMKQHEQYILEIKQIVEGDYDHYDMIKDVTQNKNRKFFDDIKETENNLLNFMQEILRAKEEYEKNIPSINDMENEEYYEEDEEENYNEYDN